MKVYLVLEKGHCTIMNKLVISKTNNPFFNIALEKELFENVQENERILYLWQNDKTVVIGRNQNPFLECDVKKLLSDGGYVARRLSGGGAVYHDLGNLNFTFVSKNLDNDIERQSKVIIEAVSKFGISSEASGRNDILTSGKKYSGHAYYEEDDKSFHHGTLLLDVDLDYLESILNPSELKLKSKGISSVRQRVVNLSALNKAINITSMHKSIKESFEECYGEFSSIYTYGSDNYRPKYFEVFSDENWIYGESPSYEVVKHIKTENGNFALCLDVESGIIKHAKVYTDAVVEVDIKHIEENLLGKKFHDVCESSTFIKENVFLK